MKQLFKFLSNVAVFSIVFVSSLVIAATTADNLMGLGMSSQLAGYINDNLVGINGSGNLVLPVASGKKLSVTVAGVEKASISSTGLLTTAGGQTATTGDMTATAGALSGLRLTSAAGAGFETIAGAGTTTSDAAALTVTKGFHQITGANGTVGWKVGSMVAGDIHVLLNTTAAVAKIYAPTGGTVNGAAADAAFSALTGIKPIICVASSTTALICS